MPLKKGTSSKTVSSNIKQEMDTFKSKGKIGNITPKNSKQAQKISVAIALSEKDRSKKK